MIEIVNRQRKIKFEFADLPAFVREVVDSIDAARGKNATIAFVSDAKMRELNGRFRGKNVTTDVLSFEFVADEFDVDKLNLGDIVISLEQAARQATENDLSLEREVKQLILHGFLHLCGYDHEQDAGEMNALELRLRDKLGIQ